MVISRVNGRSSCGMNVEPRSRNRSSPASISCMTAVVVATTLVSEATSKIASIVTGGADGSYVSRPQATMTSSPPLRTTAATAPGNTRLATASSSTASTRPRSWLQSSSRVTDMAKTRRARFAAPSDLAARPVPRTRSSHHIVDGLTGNRSHEAGVARQVLRPGPEITRRHEQHRELDLHSVLHGNAQRRLARAGQERGYVRRADLCGQIQRCPERGGDGLGLRHRERSDVAADVDVDVADPVIPVVEIETPRSGVLGQIAVVFLARYAEDTLVGERQPAQAGGIFLDRRAVELRPLQRGDQTVPRHVDAVDRDARKHPMTNVDPLRNLVEREGYERLVAGVRLLGVLQRSLDQLVADPPALMAGRYEELGQEPHVSANPAPGEAEDPVILFRNPEAVGVVRQGE